MTPEPKRLMTTLSPPLIHGPFVTGRLGKMMTVDLTAPRDHLVVERGSMIPRASVLVTTCASRMIELSKAGEKLDHLLVLGTQTDPTEHPHLREVTENLRALRDKWFGRAKLCIQTSATDLTTRDMRAAVGMYDKIIARFEWGTAKMYSSLTGNKSTGLGDLTKSLGAFGHVIVQASFFKGDVDNSTDNEIAGWIKKLQEVKPQEIHILSGVGNPNTKKTLKAVTPKRRKAIAEKVAEATGLTVTLHDDESLIPA
jgi:hypothetical protein